jgi:hypothetical protein
MKDKKLLKTDLVSCEYKIINNLDLQKLQMQLADNFGVQSFQTSKMFDLTLK